MDTAGRQVGSILADGPQLEFLYIADSLLGDLTTVMEPTGGRWVGGTGYVPLKNDARNSAARL